MSELIDALNQLQKEKNIEAKKCNFDENISEYEPCRAYWSWRTDYCK